MKKTLIISLMLSSLATATELSDSSTILTENLCNKPKKLLITTCIVGATTAAILPVGIIKLNGPWDEDENHSFSGLPMLASPPLVCATIVLGVITIVKYKRWKKCRENKNLINVELNFDNVTSTYTMKLNWDIDQR